MKNYMRYIALALIVCLLQAVPGISAGAAGTLTIEGASSITANGGAAQLRAYYNGEDVTTNVTWSLSQGAQYAAIGTDGRTLRISKRYRYGDSRLCGGKCARDKDCFHLEPDESAAAAQLSGRWQHCTRQGNGQRGELGLLALGAFPGRDGVFPHSRGNRTQSFCSGATI